MIKISRQQPHAELLKEHQWRPKEGPQLDNYLTWLWPKLRPELPTLLLAGDAKLRSSKKRFSQQLLLASPYMWAELGGELGTGRLLLLALVSCCQHLPNAASANEQDFLWAINKELNNRRKRQAAKPPRADKGRKRLKLV